jgi:acyl-CoA thioesterase FadM
MDVADASLDIDNYSYLHSLSLRYGDFDVDGCTSAAAVARYLEQARSQLIFGVTEQPFDEFLAGEFGILAARVRIGAVSHRRGIGNVQLAAGLRYAGTSSLTIRVGLFDDAGCFAVADNVLVMVNRESGRPEALPASLKERFAYWPYRGE